jgi:hypothetical protein
MPVSVSAVGSGMSQSPTKPWHRQLKHFKLDMPEVDGVQRCLLVSLWMRWACDGLRLRTRTAKDILCYSREVKIGQTKQLREVSSWKGMHFLLFRNDRHVAGAAMSKGAKASVVVSKGAPSFPPTTGPTCFAVRNSRVCEML